MTFLGLVNYCRQWIPDCSLYDKCLCSAVKHDDWMQQPIHWSDDMQQAYDALCQAICSVPALGLPNYDKPFHLYVCEQERTPSAVLAQEHEGGQSAMRPCAFLSKTLDSGVQGLPACLRVLAACVVMVQDAEKMVLSYPLIFHSPHQV